MEKLTHASTFSGIGACELAAEWAGIENIFHCEINPFALRILKYYWKNAISYEDIKTTDFSKHRNSIDILSGGFPCQDASNALQTGGGQKGLLGERTGLFWQKIRAIEEIKPKFIVSENVANILKVNKGKDFATILSELSRMGYNAEWRICYSSEVGAPHKRSRLYLVAYSNSFRIQGDQSFFSLLRQTDKSKSGTITGTNLAVNVDNEWLYKSPVYSLDDGISARLDIIAKSIEAFGNSMSPQIPYLIFKAIQAFLNNN